MGNSKTWRALMPQIGEAAESLREEAEEHSNAEIESASRQLSEELLDILRHLEALKQRSPNPPVSSPAKGGVSGTTQASVVGGGTT